MITQFSKIELCKEDMKFSAGHFTVFSSTDRENLHGHNYSLHATFITKKCENGLSFDYRFYKEMLRNICKTIDEIVIIPGLCKHLSIVDSDKHCHIMFNHEEMIFLKRDIIILSITNVTVEELSSWFIHQITMDKQHLVDNDISAIHIKVYSGPGQSGSSSWELKNDLDKLRNPPNIYRDSR